MINPLGGVLCQVVCRVFYKVWKYNPDFQGRLNILSQTQRNEVSFSLSLSLLFFFSPKLLHFPLPSAFLATQEIKQIPYK